MSHNIGWLDELRPDIRKFDNLGLSNEGMIRALLNLLKSSKGSSQPVGYGHYVALV